MPPEPLGAAPRDALHPESPPPVEAAVVVTPANVTPMLRQYLEIKARHPDALLFFRLGDFYELFYEDARVASELLGITLTSRPKGDERIPMCGVPHHSARLHIARLVEAGHRVALCDQVEVPTPGKTIVRREVTRVVTPGTLFDEDAREAKSAIYLAALVLRGERGGVLALLEASTGDFRVFVADSDAALMEELQRTEPRELLLDEETARSERLPAALTMTRTVRAGREFEAKRGFEALCRHFAVGSLDGFGLAQLPEAWGAAAAVLRYVEETQRSVLAHVRQLVRYEPGGALALDTATRKNLDLLRNSADGRRAGSLLATVDRTVTSMGGRLLQQWLLYPLTEVERIVGRQDAVEELLSSAVLREDLTGALREVGDLERLLGRLVVGQGSGRDVRLLGLSLERLPMVPRLLAAAQSPLLREVAEQLPDLSALSARALGAIVDEPPAIVREGGVFRRGYSAELDELLDLAASGKDAIARMEADERKRTGVNSLKIRFNRVFGYYIEVTKANLAHVPADYVRKQTTASGERYVTPWLQEYEGKVLTAQERSIALEQRLFEELRQHVIDAAPLVLRASRLLATLDVLLSFARVAAELDYRRPVVNSGDLLRVIEGRHPVVERALGREPFVPNDLELDHEHRLLVLTGPNMAGKSTAMRQVALIVVLAQTGSFVPAREAIVGVCDRLFTRVGAGDDLARGQSTFMVEMSETANILRHATSRSLVLLDEIGRGTSTFDGLAIAWAVAEHIHDAIRCRTIFATHYHELTQLAHEKAHVVNLTMAVREWQDRVIFLRKLVPGAASRSYGVQVAKLAGVPASVLGRAREVLANLEKAGLDETGHPVFARAGRRHVRAQLALGFQGREEPAGPVAGSPILDELRQVDINAMSPLQALQLLHRWKAVAGTPEEGAGSLQ
jgi:DNA mismatch repair protein MutS